MDDADQLQQRFRLLRLDAGLRPDPFPAHVPDGAGQFSWSTQGHRRKNKALFRRAARPEGCNQRPASRREPDRQGPGSSQRQKKQDPGREEQRGGVDQTTRRLVELRQGKLEGRAGWVERPSQTRLSGLSLDTHFNCLFQLAFINVHEPANALDMGTRLGMAVGAAVGQAGIMAASQLGLMIKEAKENVLTKSGQRINKDWMLEQIEVVKEDADLKSEFTKRENGMSPRKDWIGCWWSWISSATCARSFMAALTTREKCGECWTAISKRSRSAIGTSTITTCWWWPPSPAR